MPFRVDVAPALYQWAIERSRVDTDRLLQGFPKLAEWQSGEASPTLKQLERFAKATKSLFGYFFLPESPEERLPVVDFRTIEGTSQTHPNADLLDTIYTMQRWQAWLRETLV